MVDPGGLRRLGLFVVERFLDEALLARLLDLGRSGPAEAARVLVGEAGLVDGRVRRAGQLRLTDVLLAQVGRLLDALLPELAEHFAVRLSGYQLPQLIRYTAGDFYRAHTDNHPGGPPELAARKVSCVAFLNGHTLPVSAGGFVGGALAFYRLTPRPTPDDCRTLLRPEPGLLVAFPSGLYHEVWPVLEGERYTLVTWYT
jgi:predicted 2-oxoglutarate/Fe(II)-dependent dioxygenase YbiX